METRTPRPQIRITTPIQPQPRLASIRLKRLGHMRKGPPAMVAPPFLRLAHSAADTAPASALIGRLEVGLSVEVVRSDILGS